MLKRFNKNAVIAEKRGIFNIMYSLGFLIVELETARRRLLYVFGAPDGTPQVDLALSQLPKGLAAELASDRRIPRASPLRIA
jgi:hypothetical protein